MNSTNRFLFFIGLALSAWGLGFMQDPPPMKPAAIMGLTCVGTTPFGEPDGMQRVELTGGDFETLDPKSGLPEGWTLEGFNVFAEGAPSGKVFLESAGKGLLVSRDIPVEPGKPYLMSFWLRADNEGEAFIRFAAETTPNEVTPATLIDLGKNVEYLRRLPATGSAWKRMGLYVRAPGNARFLTADFQPEKGNTAIDDVHIRTATEEEMSQAWKAWRERFPARDMTPRPGNGLCLPYLTTRLQGTLDAQRPLTIWSLGTSYGWHSVIDAGIVLREHIRERFPQAPPVIFRQSAPPQATWQKLLPLLYSEVLPEEPDLIILYAPGKTEDLERLLAAIRQMTPADIIVPTIHWRIADQPNWGKTENAPDQDIAELRELCRKYGAEVVENRRKWAEYLIEHKLAPGNGGDPSKGLLQDDAVPNDQGLLFLAESIASHLTPPPVIEGPPAPPRIRHLKPTGGDWFHDDERVEVDTDWEGWTPGGTVIRTEKKGATIRVHFFGSRIDLAGRLHEDGGKVNVTLDDKPVDRLAGVYLSAVTADPANSAPAEGEPATGLWGVAPGTGVFPQEWTVEFLDDAGAFQLTGSTTGTDGKGTVQEDFTSTSGQMVIPTSSWVGKPSKGDKYNFSVRAAGVSCVDFKGDAGKAFVLPIVRGLAVEEHVLEIVAEENKEVQIEEFIVYETPLK